LPNGWHDRIRFIDSFPPFINPCFLKDSIEYLEQVGEYLQFEPKKGEIIN